MRYEIQPIRDFFMALCIAFLVAGWWYLVRSGSDLSPLAFMETALVFVIASEAYAKDE